MIAHPPVAPHISPYGPHPQGDPDPVRQNLRDFESHVGEEPNRRPTPPPFRRVREAGQLPPSVPPEGGLRGGARQPKHPPTMRTMAQGVANTIVARMAVCIILAARLVKMSDNVHPYFWIRRNRGYFRPPFLSMSCLHGSTSKALRPPKIGK